MPKNSVVLIDRHPGRSAQTIGVAKQLGTDPDLIHEPSVGVVGTKGDSQGRTELLVLITPRAILDRTAALQVTEEFRRKVNSLIPVDSKTRARKTQPRTQSSAEGTGWSNTSTSF